MDMRVIHTQKVSETGGTMTFMEATPEGLDGDDQETVTSWTNPWIAEYKRRQAMLMQMRPFEVIAMMGDLNLTSYGFSKNAEELQAHIWRYPEIGQSQQPRHTEFPYTLVQTPCAE